MMVQHPVLTIQTSYMGTKNVLDLAVDKKIEGMVYVSSMEVYGIRMKRKEYITEKDLGYIELENVKAVIQREKICECLCNAYAAEFGLPVKSARLAQTFGAGVLQEDNRVYAQFARSAMKKRESCFANRWKFRRQLLLYKRCYQGIVAFRIFGGKSEKLIML